MSPTAPDSTVDVVVIGSGPGGYVAALKAAGAGLRTVLIEKDARFGGTCLHVGCIPSKAFLHAAWLLDEIRGARKFGVTVARPELNWTGLQRRSGQVIGKLSRGVALLLRRAGVETIHGFGRLAGPGVVEVLESQAPESGVPIRRLATKNVVIATGSEARTLPFLPVDGERIVTNAEMFGLPALPARLGIIGAGAVGVEFASMFRAYGSQVEIFEILPRVVPLEDEEVSAEVLRAFRRRRIRVRTGAAVEACDVEADGVQVRYRAGDRAAEATFDQLLVAVGRAPRTSGIGLETVGLGAGRGGFLEVDGACRTQAPGVYAIGDVIGSAQLAHVASAEAEAAVAAIAGREPPPLRAERMPAATYCIPEVGSVGLTEAAARASGREISVGRFPFAANSKANILGDLTGFVKIVAEARDGEVLGVHIVGPHATDLIAEAVVALEHEATLESLARSVHPHPTLSEAVAEAAMAALGQPLHA